MNPTSRLVGGLEIGGHGAHPAAGDPRATSPGPEQLAAAGRQGIFSRYRQFDDASRSPPTSAPGWSATGVPPRT